MKKKILAIGVLGIALLIAGCGGGSEVSPRPIESYSYSYTPSTSDMVSVDVMARDLNLKVDKVNPTHITLKNSGNTVMLFTHSGANFFVNGKEIGKIGQIDNSGGKFYVPRGLAANIRPHLGKGSIISSNKLPWFKPVSGTVVIDPGHGGKDPGAISPRGFYEKKVNLQVAQKLAYRLKKRGIKVIMTRNGDYYVELNERAQIANRNNADLFVSIHADSNFDRSMQGFSVFVARGASANSQKVARAISKHMSKISPHGNGIRRADYRVLVKTKMPAVLVEMGFISNHTEAGMIATDGFQNKVADAITVGICDVINQI